MICVIRVRIHKGILMRSTPKNDSNYIDEVFIWNWDYFDGQELFFVLLKKVKSAWNDCEFSS